MMKRSFVRNVAGALLAVALFVQVNAVGLPLDAGAKSWVMFSVGASIAGLTVFKLREDGMVTVGEYNDVFEAGAIAEYGRLEAEKELNSLRDGS